MGRLSAGGFVENPVDIEQNLEPPFAFEREPLSPGAIELLTHKSCPYGDGP